VEQRLVEFVARGDPGLTAAVVSAQGRAPINDGPSR